MNFLAKLSHVVRNILFRKQDTKLISLNLEDKEFWDQAHRNRAHLWLTGSAPGDVLSRLRVSDMLKKDAVILDVGVGEGYMAKYLKRAGITHDSLDISTNALERVKNVSRKCYEHHSDLPQGEYSLIMHHLVAQHMSYEDLRLQLSSLIDALAHGGVLAIQYVEGSETEDLEFNRQSGAMRHSMD